MKEDQTLGRLDRLPEAPPVRFQKSVTGVLLLLTVSSEQDTALFSSGAHDTARLLADDVFARAVYRYDSFIRQSR